MKKGKTVKLKATVKPSNAKVKTIVWKSSSKSIATVSNKGVVKGIKNGSATITATVKGTKVKATCKIKVGTPVTKMTIKDGSKLAMNLGSTKKLSVSVTPKKASNKKVTYTSSKPSIVAVSSTGKMTAKAVGTAKITVKAQDGSGKKDSITVTVNPIVASSVSLTAAATTIEVGAATTVKATVLPADTTDKTVTYSSDNSKIAVVDKNGTVTGKAVGTVNIVAKTTNGKTGSIKLSVVAKTIAVTGIEVDEAVVTASWDQENLTKLRAHVVPENATNQDITWTVTTGSENVAVDKNGVLTPKKVGNAKVVATASGGKISSKTIAVTIPSVPVTAITLTAEQDKLEIGNTTKLAVAYTPAYTTDAGDITYSSSNTRVATVEDGVVTAVGVGEADITAVLNSDTAITTKCTIQVIAKVTGVSLDETKELTAGSKEKLTAVVTPEDASNRNLSWSSDNEAVASVDNYGNVTAVSEGTAKITAKTEDGGFTASCTVTVKPAVLTGIYLNTSMRALKAGENVKLTVAAPATFAELNTALAAAAGGTVYDAVYLSTSESGAFEIPAGDYPNTVLIVDAPNATVTNHATVKSVEIRAISSNTWIEKATGNTIDIVAASAHVIVAENSSAAITVAPEVSFVAVDNNGTISSMAIKAKAEVTITGNNSNVIPISAEAADMKIITSMPVAITAKQIIAVQVLPGAEANTTVSVADSALMPTITGVGVIPVTNTTTNTTTDVVADYVAPSQDETETVAKGSITGIVKDVFEKGIADAVVYLIPYTMAFDGNQIQAAINAAENQEVCYITTTNANGQYTTAGVSYGNYVLIVKAVNCKTLFQTTVVTQEKINNEAITLAEDTDATGDVSGVLKDAATGQPVVAGITLAIRQGANNVSGDPYATVDTDASGKYSFKDLPTGTYCIQADDTREDVEEHYVRVTFNINILANVSTEWNSSISKSVEGDQIRFVLTWAAEDYENNTVPRDLDSHILGPKNDGDGQFHVYFANRSYSDEYDIEGEETSDRRMVDLDVDDTTFEGPETTTIYQKINGDYHYYIYDFTEQDDSDNMKLATSQAVVKVYIGDRNVATYNVPYEKGTLWDVCTYNSSTNVLTPINTVYYFEGDSGSVGMSPEEILSEKIEEYLSKIQAYDLGETVNAELAAKITALRTTMQSASYEVIDAAYQDLKSYVKDMTASAEITGLDADFLHSMSIGSYDITINELRESAVNITVYGESPDYNTLQVTTAENAAYQIVDSDNESYEKLIVVTNSVTQAVRKYYIDASVYTPSWRISRVTEEGNTIYDMYKMTLEDGTQAIIIYGKNATLENPVFEVDDRRTTVSYAKAAGQTYAGVATITYQDQHRDVRIYYEQKEAPGADDSYTLSDFYLNGIDDSANQNCILRTNTRIHNNYVYLVDVSGVKENLGLDAQLAIENNESDTSITDYVVEEVTGESWNYKVTFTSEEKEYEIYINYKQVAATEYLPLSGYVKEQDERIYRTESVTLVNVGGVEKLRVCAQLDESACDLSKTFFYSQSGAISFSYEVRTEGEQTYVDILHSDVVLLSYELFYEKSVKFLDDAEITCTDGDNYIWSTGVDYHSAEEGRFNIYGENAALGSEYVLTVTDPLATATYEKTEGQEYAGILTLTYKTQKYVLPVYYEQRLRPFYLTEITDPDNYLKDLDSEEVYDEVSHEDYDVYTIDGMNEKLGANTSFEFRDDFVPDSYELTEVTGHTAFNYILTVTKNGLSEPVYIRYTCKTDIDLLPFDGTMTIGGYTNSLDYFELIEVDGVETVRALGYLDDEEWADATDVTYEFVDSQRELSYSLTTEDDGTRILHISIGEKEIRQYPFIYEKNMGLNSFSPYFEFTDGSDNYICSSDFEYGSGALSYLFVVAGENANVTEGYSFKYSYNDKVTVTTQPYDGEEYFCTATAKYKTQVKEFKCRYVQEVRYFEIAAVTETGTAFTKPEYSDSFYDQDSGRYCNICVFSGMSEELSELTKFTFTDGFEADSCQLTKVDDNENYNYLLAVTKNGLSVPVYIRYTCKTDIDVLPSDGIMTIGGNSNSLDSFQLIDVDGVETVRALGYLDDEEWAAATDVTYEFQDNRVNGNLTYSVTKEADGTQILYISAGEKEIRQYPFIYEKNMRIESFSPYYKFTDGSDNYISNRYFEYDSDSHSYLFVVVGESTNVTDGYSFEYDYNDKVTVTTQPYDGEDCFCTVTAKYKTQVKEFKCRYVQGLRSFVIAAATEAGTAFTKPEQYEWFYDEVSGMGCWIYSFAGISEELSELTKFTFTNGFEADTQTITPVEGKENYNYTLTLTKNGLTETFFIRYQQLTLSQLLPESAYCYDESGTRYEIGSVELVQTTTEAGEELDCVQIMSEELSEEEFNTVCWASLKFDSQELFTYWVVQTDGVNTIEIDYKNEVFAVYPLIYKQIVSTETTESTEITETTESTETTEPTE